MARFNLPDIEFLEVDASEYENMGVAKFEELQNVSLSEADPRRKVLQAVALVATVLANNIDHTGKQNLITYANDDSLEHLGAKKDVFRLPPIAAKTVLRYDVNNPEEFTIPEGTRVSVNDLTFATISPQIVEVGAGTVDITAECETAGTIGNGFLPGQITSLVDPLPWVSKVTNITTSSGGSDWETDDALADRIRNANESFSTTGPELAYVYAAKSASQRITDVKILSTAPSEINIVLLMENGELPTEDDLNLVLKKCSARDVRPLTDRVSASPAEQYVYNLEVSYYLPQSVIDRQEYYQADVNAALQEYILWQKSKLGRGIDPSELYARLSEAGAKRISVEPNQYIELEEYQVAKEGTINLTFGGFVND
ncbi:baseplate assembly protein [Bacillus infantis]|uniref:baseplate assembly protein n=1 Tax=Bacillus infantis TaxID=324767 RepID=UPI00321B8681